VKTFDTEAKASAYLANRTNRVPGNFKPRETPDGWVLSRPERSRTEAQRANDEKLARVRRTFNPERDPLVTFMGKMGGIRADELLADGVDPEDLKGLRSGVVGKPAYRKKGGLSLDAMAELAAAHGFDVLDEAGRPDATKMRELIEEELSGNHLYTPEGYERLASLEAEQREREERARFENDFDEGELQRAGYDDLSPEGQELVTQAFEDDLDGLVASLEHAGKGLTDEEAHDLFRRSTEQLPQEAEVAAARGADEGARHDQEPALREAEPKGLVAQSARRYGDTETFEVSAAQGSGPGFAIRSPAGQLDLFTQAPVPRDSGGGGGSRAAPAVYATQISPAKRGEVRVGFDRIDTPERAAHVFAGLRKAPREYFAVLVLDKDDKPIAYLDLFHGAMAETSVHPQIVTSAVFQTPGARSIWLAHNHPSGVPEPSMPDMRITETLKQHLGKDLGVEYRGHVIIAGQRAVEIANAVPFDIPAAARTMTVPIMERRVVKSGKLDTASVTSPEKARQMADEFGGGKEGLLFTDHQYRPVAFVPLKIASLKKLRTGDKESGFGALIQMFAKSGGDHVISYAPHEDGKSAGYREGLANLTNALSGLDFKLLDAIDQRPGTAALRGDLPRESYNGFFSRASSQEKKPVFYSELERRLDTLPQNAGSSQQWKGLIDNLASKGVKREEIEWSGVKDWLDLQQGKVTKDQLQAFLRDNGVKVDETVLSDAGAKAATSDIDRLAVQLDARGYTVVGEPDAFGGNSIMALERRSDGQEFDITQDGAYASENPHALGVDEVPEDVRDLVQQLQEAEGRRFNEEHGSSEGNTRYSQYTLPGGENYRELLLTLPASPHPKLARFRALEALDKQTPEQQAEYNRLGRELFPRGHSAPAGRRAHERAPRRFPLLALRPAQHPGPRALRRAHRRPRQEGPLHRGNPERLGAEGQARGLPRSEAAGAQCAPPRDRSEGRGGHAGRAARVGRPDESHSPGQSRRRGQHRIQGRSRRSLRWQDRGLGRARREAHDPLRRRERLRPRGVHERRAAGRPLQPAAPHQGNLVVPRSRRQDARPH
jgi:hypothetical protein